MTDEVQGGRGGRLLKIWRTLLWVGIQGAEDRSVRETRHFDVRGNTDHTWPALENLTPNRRTFLRIKEPLAEARFVSGELADVARSFRSRAGFDGPQGLLRLLLEIDLTRRSGLRVLKDKRLAVHAEIFRGMFLYVLAFLDAQGASPGSAGGCRFDISGSGICFPTEVRHRAGERFFAVLFLPMDPVPPLKLVLEAVRPSQPSPDGAYLTAARFVEVDCATRSRILAYVAARQRGKMLDRAYRLGEKTCAGRLRTGLIL